MQLLKEEPQEFLRVLLVSTLQSLLAHDIAAVGEYLETYPHIPKAWKLSRNLINIFRDEGLAILL
jgi:hypothetical protein